MRYTIKTSGLVVADWQGLRKAVFGDAQPVYEQFGGGATYAVEFAEPVTPANLGPLIKVEPIPSE
jgi:hypothetical protein